MKDNVNLLLEYYILNLLSSFFIFFYFGYDMFALLLECVIIDSKELVQLVRVESIILLT